MNRIVLLDAGPLGMITNPAADPQTVECRQWLARLARSRAVVAVPEIADYEVRRELLRADKREGVARLDALKTHPAVLYLPITTRAMLRAAALWAAARQRHRPTAPDQALDADAILAGQAYAMAVEADEVVVATTNPAHLSRFVKARLWHEVT